MADQELMEYFDFNEFDLNSNRNGSLSPKQNSRLAQSDKSARKKFLIIGLVSAALVVLPTLILWLIDKLESVGWYSLTWVIPFGLIAFFLIRAGLKSTRYTVKMVEGLVKITEGGSYNDPDGDIYYELRVGKKRFGIGPELASLMKKDEGSIYAVYYYWGSDTVETDLMDSYIMSLEKVSKGDGPKNS